MLTNNPAGRPALGDIREAQARIQDKIHRTPLLTSAWLNEQCAAHLFFKCENFQKVGAFKARGATNAVFSLSANEARGGVATHSSGNHAAALSRAAKLRGIPAHIVMPNNSPQAKQAAVRGYGGRIVFCDSTMDAREATCAQVVAATGATLIHPYNDWRIIAGQGTAALEMIEDIPDLDMILVPVGGGGLLCGTAIAAKGLRPTTRVIGVEPAEADDAYQSFRSGKLIKRIPNTIADGLRVSVGDLNFPIMREMVDDIVTVSEDAIIAAMRRIWEVLKIVIEPSAAVPYAAILEQKVPLEGRRIGLIITGGNVDLDSLPWNRK